MDAALIHVDGQKKTWGIMAWYKEYGIINGFLLLRAPVPWWYLAPVIPVGWGLMAFTTYLLCKLDLAGGTTDYALSWKCVLLAMFFCVVSFWGTLFYSTLNEQEGGYNAGNPRVQTTRQSGFGAILHGAMTNMQEDLAVFGVAVAAATNLKLDANVVGNLCIIHIIFRIAYYIAYLAQLNFQRAALFIGGMFTNFAIIGCALYPGFASYFGGAASVKA